MSDCQRNKRQASVGCSQPLPSCWRRGVVGVLLSLGLVAVWMSTPRSSAAERSGPLTNKASSERDSNTARTEPVQALPPAVDRTFYSARIQPIFDRSCVGCHGPEKAKGGLRLDSYTALARGGDSGPIIVPGAPEKSEIYRRITLPHDNEEVMPSDGKKLLTRAQQTLLGRWIAAGASLESEVLDGASWANDPSAAPAEPAAPDYRPYQSQIAALEAKLPVRLVPVSQSATDGLILRTISTADRVDDAVVAELAPLSELIVDAELARTRITDKALSVIAQFVNLRRLDLAHTRITSAGMERLDPLKKLQSINLVATQVDDSAWSALRRLPALRHIYGFETNLKTAPSDDRVDAP